MVRQQEVVTMTEKVGKFKEYVLEKNRKNSRQETALGRDTTLHERLR